jgi:alpha-L-rhamnosidase
MVPVNRRELLLSAGGAVLATSLARAAPWLESPAFAQLRARQSAWLDRAQSLIPTLTEAAQSAVSLVRPIPDDSLPLRYRMDREAPAVELENRLLNKGDSFILDFEGHRTGHLSFELVGEGKGVDAPVRLRLTFGEVPTDVAEPLYPYNGHLATGWLPDEIINVDDLPQTVQLPRRYAFRFVKVEVIDTSPTFAVRFRNVRAMALTSASSAPAPLHSGDALLDRIDAVGIATLRDCMQTVFEDGPRRDRRLWIGDLRLQALAAYATFGGYGLVKRCLYLFAAFPRPEDGLLGACVYEKPSPRYGGIHILDYAALFNAALCDYVEATRDVTTGSDLWPVAHRQVELLTRYVDADGLFVDPKSLWLFVDWNERLDRTASIQGILIYAFMRTRKLAQLLGRDRDVAGLDARIARMQAAARRHLLDPKLGVFVSGPNGQVSWASQAWLAIAKAVSPEESAHAMRQVAAMPQAIRPTTPYLYHYVVEGLLAANLRSEALSLIKAYWGGMISAGADTFWEIYDPDRPLSSPYGDIHINSYCHAWSCTPSYFLRARFPSGFARGSTPPSDTSLSLLCALTVNTLPRAAP